MIALNSILVIFMIEALIALTLLIVTWFLFARKKTQGEQQASHDVIDKLQDSEKIKEQKLNELIDNYCDLEPEAKNELLAKIKSNERCLYQQIIQLLLNRDIDILNSIDQHIDNLSQPYCELLNYSKAEVDTGPLEQQAKKNQQLMKENNNLGEQLVIAIKTMDEISDEYTRVFSGTQTELELENSSKKMFTIFHQAEQKVRTTMK